MITIEQAKLLNIGDIIIRETTPMTAWRVLGEIKLQKKNPKNFELPILYGIYIKSYLNQDNCEFFTLERGVDERLQIFRQK